MPAAGSGQQSRVQKCKSVTATGQSSTRSMANRQHRCNDQDTSKSSPPNVKPIIPKSRIRRPDTRNEIIHNVGEMKAVARKLLVVWVSLTVRMFLVTLVILYALIPTVIYTNPWLTKKIVFLNMVRWPPFIDLSKPHELGLHNTHHFFLESEPSLKIGVWHMLPDKLSESVKTDGFESYENTLTSGVPIILYLHGNGGTRGGYHRVQLYKVLRKEYHVITIDYRGFGDSAGSPSEDGLIHDAKFIYHWIRARSGNVPIFLWGHSMGSGVTTKLAKELCEEGMPSTGVVLESPFNNFRDAATHYPLSLPYRYMPYFDSIFLDSIKYNDIYLASDENIAGIKVPLLMLHAEDDRVVPFDLGEKLYKAALATRTVSTVEFVTFDGSHGYGHKHIHKAPELMDVVRKFTDGKKDAL